MDSPKPASPEQPPDPPAGNGADADPGPARALTVHVLRMIETRMDAAGIAISTEVQSFGTRMQLKLIAAGALFIAIWGGIVLLAIALPEAYRIPVLGAVVLAFAGGALWAQLAAKKTVASTEVGSLRWFLDSLKQDLDVLTRSLHRRPDAAPRPESIQ